MLSFTGLVLSQWRDPSLPTKATLAVDGRSLTIADVVEVSRQLKHVELTSESINAIEACSKIIPEKIAKGNVIYGVNTGFGGSADTRSNDAERVQQSLISHLTCGIVADGKQQPVLKSNGHLCQSNSVTHLGQSNGNLYQSNGVAHCGQSNGSNGVTHHNQSNGITHPSQSNGVAEPSKDLKKQRHRTLVKCSLPLNDPLAATCMPESWARASMIIRLNSLSGGASGIRVDIAESLVNLLNQDVVPRIPVRGSISASGDLSALAWIGAVMQGKSSATAFAGPRDVDGARRVARADVALEEAGIAPISLRQRRPRHRQRHSCVGRSSGSRGV